MSRKNLILGGIFIALFAIVYLFQGPFKEWRENLGRPENFLARLDPADINQIEITRGNEETVALARVGERWKIAGTKEFYVKDSLAQSLEAALYEAVKADVEVVSTNRERKDEFATGDSGVRVRLLQGEAALADFVAGLMGQDYASAYVSEPEKDVTYALKANIHSVLNRDDWYDRTIFQATDEEIGRLRFQYPDREFTVEKTDGIWQGTLPYRFSVSAEKADAINEVMNSLEAAEVPRTQDFSGSGLEKHRIIIEATGENLNRVLMVGDEAPGGGFFAKRGDSDNIYIISKDTEEMVNVTIRSLR